MGDFAAVAREFSRRALSLPDSNCIQRNSLLYNTVIRMRHAAKVRYRHMSETVQQSEERSLVKAIAAVLQNSSNLDGIGCYYACGGIQVGRR